MGTESESSPELQAAREDLFKRCKAIGREIRTESSDNQSGVSFEFTKRMAEAITRLEKEGERLGITPEKLATVARSEIVEN